MGTGPPRSATSPASACRKNRRNSPETRAKSPEIAGGGSGGWGSQNPRVERWLRNRCALHVEHFCLSCLMTNDHIEFCTHAYNFLVKVSIPAATAGSDLGIARDLVWNALADTGAAIFVE